MLIVAGAGSSAIARGLTRVQAVTPEQFGALGDGTTDDTAAFAAMAAFVSARRGGDILLRRATYMLGRQQRQRGGDYAFEPAPIMDFIGCSQPLTIRGNGAKLKCRPGLRFGTFHSATGRPTRNRMPYTEAGELATPYRSMIRVERCSGSVAITDLELDGDLGSLVVGGQYGDVGWQIPAIGIHLIDNAGRETLRRIYCHHHALDGIMIDGLDHRHDFSTLEDVVTEHNGRQGCSVVGGRGYAFTNCKFNHSGKAEISSPPGAGVDIESERGKHVSDLRFVACEFSNNSGVGMVADTGPSEGATFDRCTFVGTTNWAAWPNKPRFRFTSCSFVGPIVHAFGDSNPQRATRFTGCLFRDDPALSPTREVYGGENLSRPIADLPQNPNVTFDRCTFLLTHDAVLPWTTNVVTFADCRMSQRAAAQSYPRGTFVGHNILKGNVNLYSAKIVGEVFLNGKFVGKGD